jgi:hypothetical protein
MMLGFSSLETQIFNSASRSKVPAVSILNLEMLLYEMDLYSVLLPVKPCLSTRMSLLEVKIKVSRISLKPNSISSPSIKRVPYCFSNWSWLTVPALPRSAEKIPILLFVLVIWFFTASGAICQKKRVVNLLFYFLKLFIIAMTSSSPRPSYWAAT